MDTQYPHGWVWQRLTDGKWVYTPQHPDIMHAVKLGVSKVFKTETEARNYARKQERKHN